MNKELQAIIEATLFVRGDEGITLKQLAEILELSQEELQPQMEQFMKEYNQNEDRGIEMVILGGCYKLVSKSLAHPYLQKLYEDESQITFSQAALETLAIIAYKQPITRVEIEEIRGVGCDMMIKKLLAKNLIREAGRLDTVGLPYTYEVTEEFMNRFSLADLSELPALPDYQKEVQDSELFD